MQKAKLILAKLNQKSKGDKSFKFKRLYRNLFNIDFYLNAYSKIYYKPGNMTEGIDNETIDGTGYKRIANIIEMIRQEKFYPSPVRRVYIPKKNGKKRPLGIPRFSDKLVQEVIREILEAIYEPIFSKNSCGFRSQRSCHTALIKIKKCNGTNWVIEGDITAFFDSIDHEILIDILKRKIEDGRLLELIRRFLKAGYVENNQKRKSLSGTPQGGIISPILANIYLNELDNYMEEIINNYTTGTKRKRNKLYRNLSSYRTYYRNKGNIIKAKELLKRMRSMSTIDPMDTEYRRVRYVRYADDFVILINGSKDCAKEIKNKVGKFLKEKLKLELNESKTLITNPRTENAKFLGYEFSKVNDFTYSSKGRNKRAINGVIQLYVPSATISEMIKKYTEKGKCIHNRELLNLSVYEIISQYNAEIRGLYNYFKLANNVGHQLNRFRYYQYRSLLMTIAAKEKTSVGKITRKYGFDVPCKRGTGTRKVIGINYQTQTGKKTLLYFNESFKKEKDLYSYKYNSVNPSSNEKELIKRIKNTHCELCNEKTEIQNIVVHHVRKLNELKQKYRNKTIPIQEWEKKMIKINRKTLVLCDNCHKKIHLD